MLKTTTKENSKEIPQKNPKENSQKNSKENLKKNSEKPDFCVCLIESMMNYGW